MREPRYLRAGELLQTKTFTLEELCRFGRGGALKLFSETGCRVIPIRPYPKTITLHPDDFNPVLFIYEIDRNIQNLVKNFKDNASHKLNPRHNIIFQIYEFLRKVENREPEAGVEVVCYPLNLSEYGKFRISETSFILMVSSFLLLKSEIENFDPEKPDKQTFAKNEELIKEISSLSYQLKLITKDRDRYLMELEKIKQSNPTALEGFFHDYPIFKLIYDKYKEGKNRDTIRMELHEDKVGTIQQVGFLTKSDTHRQSNEALKVDMARAKQRAKEKQPAG